MHKLITISILTLFLLSSCVVSKKSFDELSSENKRISNLLYKNTKQLKKLKEQQQLTLIELDSITAELNNLNNNYAKNKEYLKYTIDQLTADLSENDQRILNLKRRLSLADSINKINTEKLNWLRKNKQQLQKQLENTIAEKQTINEMLLACTQKEKNAIKNLNSNKNTAMISFSKKQYAVYISGSADKIKMGLKDQTNTSYKSLGNLVSKLDKEEIVFATNAGMYLENNEPKGLYIEKGKIINPVDKKTEGYGNFYMQPNGIFLIKKDTAYIITTADYIKKKPADITFATQSGPMLLINNKINPKFAKNSKHLNIRSGVGVNDKNQIVFIKSNAPVTFYELAKLFQEKYHCKNALYLDGVISRMYLPELNLKDTKGNFGPIIYVTK